LSTHFHIFLDILLLVIDYSDINTSVINIYDPKSQVYEWFYHHPHPPCIR